MAAFCDKDPAAIGKIDGPGAVGSGCLFMEGDVLMIGEEGVEDIPFFPGVVEGECTHRNEDAGGGQPAEFSGAYCRPN